MGLERREERRPLVYDSLSEENDIRRANLFNVIFLGCVFCLLFIAFSVVQILEAKVNADLGRISLSVLYGVFTVSGFIAGFVVQKAGERIALVVGSSSYVAYIAANVYPEYYTLLPTAAYLGFGASILWAAQGAYLAKSSDKDTLGYYSGVFFACFMASNVIGNIISGLLIYYDKSVHFLFYVLLGIAGVAMLLFLLLRKPRRRADPEDEEEDDSKKKASLKEIFLLFKEPKMLLMIPALIYSGFSQSFFNSAVPAMMPLTHGWLFFLMAFFGLADTLSSIVLGRLSDKIGKKPVIALATLCTAAGCAVAWVFFAPGITTWHDDGAIWPFFIIMGLFGISDAGYNTQLYAVLGHFEPKRLEAAYAFLKMFQAGSTAIAFAYTLYLPSIQDFVLLLGSCLVVGFVCFIICDLCVAKVDPPSGGHAPINDA